MTIHREGYRILIAVILVLLVINFAVYTYAIPLIFWIMAVASLVLFLLVLQFFRNPSRTPVINDNLVIAPADGKVVVIEETTETEFLNKPCIQISIFMSPLNVHINRMPVSGKIKFLKYHPGKYLVAWHPKSSTENERTTIVVGMPSGVDILFRQIAGAVARRIKWYVQEEETVKQGDEFGFIRFGSRVDIFLPTNAEVKVKIDDKTVGGKTILAELP